MIRVKLFHRNRRSGNFSIEGVFREIKKGLADRVMFEEYEIKGDRHPLFSVLHIREQGATVNHIAGDVHFLALGLPSKNTIVTIHDIGHYERTLQGFSKLIYKMIWLKWPLLKADFITCVSEFTKKRLVEAIGIDEKKIRVIHNPCPPEFIYSPKKLNLENPVILQVGKAHNKNREGLIHATKGMKSKLVFIGKLSDEHIDLLKAYGTAYDNPLAVSDTDIYAYYRDADLLYFASYYEGFGLPIMEAQAVGRPVITSRVASMPEVAGDGALFVDPYSVNEIRDALNQVLTSEDLADGLVRKGLANVKRFDLSKIADQYYQLYKLVSSNAR